MDSWLNETKEWISDPEDRIVEITQLKQQTDQKKKGSNIQDLWVNIKHANLQITGNPGEEGKWYENIFEEITFFLTIHSLEKFI